MPSISVNIATGADDGFAILNYGVWGAGNYAGTNLNAGRTVSGSGTNIGALRFQNINIPQASTISSATLSMVKNFTTGTPNIRVYGDAVDNAGVWGAGNHVNSITKTTAFSAFDTTNSSSSTNVTTIVQEIINRAGWTSGNALSLGLFNQAGSANNFWQGYAYEAGGTKIPNLSVTYTGGPPPSGSYVFVGGFF